MMTTPPLISIIVPCYNAAKFVSQTLDSILAQTYPHYEIVAVDDGSTDRSPVILDQYAAQHPDRIRVFHQVNQGVAHTRMNAIAQARGEFVLPLDADDWLTPEAIAELVSYQQAHPQFAAVYSLWYMTDEDGTVLGVTPVMDDRIGERLEGKILPTVLNGNTTLPTVLIRKAALIEVGGYLREDLEKQPASEDYLCHVRLLLAGYEFGHVPKPLLYYRNTPGSLSKNKQRAYNGMIGVFTYLTRLYPEQMAKAWYEGFVAHEDRHRRVWIEQQALSQAREDRIADLDRQLHLMHAQSRTRETLLADYERRLQETTEEGQRREALLADLHARLLAMHAERDQLIAALATLQNARNLENTS